MIKDLAQLVRALPTFVAWRLARWNRTYHVSRHTNGDPVTNVQLDAMEAEYQLRLKLRSLTEGRLP